MLHGGPSSKRTWCYSNMSEVSSLDVGRLKKDDRERDTSAVLTRPSHAIWRMKRGKGIGVATSCSHVM